MFAYTPARWLAQQHFESMQIQPLHKHSSTQLRSVCTPQACVLQFPTQKHWQPVETRRCQGARLMCSPPGAPAAAHSSFGRHGSEQHPCPSFRGCITYSCHSPVLCAHAAWPDVSAVILAFVTAFHSMPARSPQNFVFFPYSCLTVLKLKRLLMSTRLSCMPYFSWHTARQRTRATCRVTGTDLLQQR